MSAKSIKAQGFSRESIRKVLRLAGEYRAMYMAMGTDDIKICISTGNRKIGHVMNVSLMPMVTCANCKECMHFCYDIKACLQYPNTVIAARMRNTCLYWKDRTEYFARIEKAINRRRKNKFFRWHVAGDIPDRWYLSQMVNIARNHPDFKFWTYTKNYDTVNEFVRIHGGEKTRQSRGIFPLCFPSGRACRWTIRMGSRYLLADSRMKKFLKTPSNAPVTATCAWSPAVVASRARTLTTISTEKGKEHAMNRRPTAWGRSLIAWRKLKTKQSRKGERKMESKLAEKKAVLDVIETMIGGVHWETENRQQKVKNWEDIKRVAMDSGEEVDPDCWDAQQARSAEAWLNALETVKKHLEKLI
jgi:hypothetical protein